MNTETMERMRPAAVERHVRSVLRRSLCDDFTIQRGTQAAVRALNAGNTAHRAIRAGIEVGMQQRMLARALGPAPLTPRDHFMRDVLLDCFGDRLVFPSDFIGRGDMSRGALLLRAARVDTELAYTPVAGAVYSGKRAPRVSDM